MHRWVAAALAMSLPLAFAMTSAEAKTIKLAAHSLWKKTGITVQAGDVIAISATGKWSWNGGTRWGPDGDPTDDFNAFDLFQPFDFFSQARLIAYIGDAPKQKRWGDSSFFPQMSGYFSIGSGQTFTAPYGGKLWLGFNDGSVTESTGDNVGVVTAEVTIKAAGTTGPSIAIASPSGVYVVGQSVQVQYACSGGTIVSCAGPVANGGALDATLPGHYAFTVVAKDDQGNTSSATSTYVVADASSSAVWPTGGAFDPTFVGAKSKLIPFFLTNPQASAMNISSIAIGNDSYGEFHIFGTTCGAALGAHKTCKISVQYQPVNPTTARAELDVSADFPAVPVPLWGNGTQVRALPDAVDFSDQPVGSGTTKAITLTNNQTKFLAIKGIAITGSAFGMSPDSTCPVNGKLAIGKSCLVVVTFSPAEAGAYSGTVQIHGSTEIDPVSIPLAGNGVN